METQSVPLKSVASELLVTTTLLLFFQLPLSPSPSYVQPGQREHDWEYNMWIYLQDEELPSSHIIAWSAIHPIHRILELKVDIRGHFIYSHSLKNPFWGDPAKCSFVLCLIAFSTLLALGLQCCNSHNQLCTLNRITSVFWASFAHL